MKSLRLPALRIFALFFALASVAPAPADARMLRGDMEVAGAPVMPHETPYDWAYDCEAELTDKFEERDRKLVADGKEVEYDLWAVAKFRLEKKKRFFSSDQLAWKWVASYYSGGEKVEQFLEKAPRDAFSTRGHYGSIDIRPNWEKGADRVSLSISAILPVGDYYHTETATEDSTRDDASFSAKADAILWKQRVRKEEEAAPLHRRLFVYCTKVK